MKKEHLTAAAIEEKRLELEKELGKNVRAFSFLTDDEEQIVGYLQEPSRIAKMRAMDKQIMSMSEAGEIMLEASLIKAASNPRITSTDQKDDKIFIGACIFARRWIEFYLDGLKKN